ncbi:drug/metabolite transporter (DMT)-like permease [Salirhabdus euzebyi]|uniref:Drug/metabolite transporter (DMT)-like permease n=1 Tax=Salirhabdus euzebyi TaxID=394506 RepID=A0A841Q960_9BACI|nr:DMT family transporter [Salirhabdus euzebyi]MBB6454843.1 drug/metabolite transporter (DMT)-like permease [Salirhabdus euzebyi]
MKRPLLFIILGASLWGTIGWFVKHLYAYGFSPLEVVAIRVSFSAFILLLYFCLKERKFLRLHRVIDLKYFIGTGIFSIVFFNYCLFTTIQMSTLPVATALLYTAPIMVTVLSRLIFKELFTKGKVMALFLSMMGIVFIVELFPTQQEKVTFGAILFGLGSGLGYALYSIFSKFALVKYHSKTITLYTFVVAALFLLPLFPLDKISILLQPTPFFFAFGLGFFPTAFAYIIYTVGLKEMEASKASIFTTIEPIIATIIGITIFQEAFSLWQAIGMLAIIAAVILLETQQKKHILPNSVT